MPMVVILLACRPPEVEPPGSEPTVSEPALTATVGWSSLVPTIPTIGWTEPPGTVRSWVEYGLDGAFDHTTPPGAPGLVVLGLKAGRTYTARAVSETPAGRVESEPLTLEVPAAPPGLPSLVVELAEPEAEAPNGFVLSTVTSALGGAEVEAFVAIWDGDGDPVWWIANPRGHLTVSPSFGTTPGTVLFDDYDMSDSRRADTGHIVQLDGSDAVAFPLPDGHHAVIEPEPGILVWIAADLRPSPVEPDVHVTADRLYEAAADGTPREVVALYDALYGGTYDVPCWHPEVGVPYGDLYPVYEWSHLNSVVYLPTRDAYLLNLRWVDTVLLVDRSTGAILWRMGGPYGEFTTPAGDPLYTTVDDSVLSHAHLSDAWDGGLVAFDNGSHRTPQVSSIVELEWDESAHTVSEVFRWPDPEGRFVGIIGDVRKLPGGDYLAAWSTLGEITEVDPAGRLVWKLRTDPLRSLGRLQWIPELVR